MTASIWTPGSSIIPQADANNQIKSQTFTAAEGQQNFTLTDFIYVAGGGALHVFLNGVKQEHSSIYELSNTSFALAAGAELGDIVEAVGNTTAASADSAASAAAASAAEAANSAFAAAEAAASVTSVAAEVAQIEIFVEAASDSATAAAASYDSFDDRYLGAKASEPTTDNDGFPLVVGALYYSTTLVGMYVWSGTAWLLCSASSSPQTLVDGATVAWDWHKGNAKLTLAGNRTLLLPTNMVDGQYCSLRVNRTGAYILSFASAYKISSIVQSNVSAQIDHFVFRYDAASGAFELAGFRANIGV